ncbi:rhodanese domain-containing protein [Haematococcus lacustris]|uniref:Rhodanese domain-containing protein n=1 Tax=Haematococcus lacustris TaxID=44745 RepID=A0A699YMQ4_HAELA|nr:rhodanese domain-containing protein [Haematococcus lacustris]
MTSLGYITADELIARLEAQGDSEGAGTASTLVLDVRDDDRAGGHIKGSVHLPSSTLDDSQLDKVITQHLAAQQPPAVVVHCMLSQQRGLRAAQRLASRLAELKLDTPVLVLEGGYKKFSAAASSAPHLIDEA